APADPRGSADEGNRDPRGPRAIRPPPAPAGISTVDATGQLRRSERSYSVPGGWRRGRGGNGPARGILQGSPPSSGEFRRRRLSGGSPETPHVLRTPTDV